VFGVLSIRWDRQWDLFSGKRSRKHPEYGMTLMSWKDHVCSSSRIRKHARGSFEIAASELYRA
jgi:hypothetical protein